MESGLLLVAAGASKGTWKELGEWEGLIVPVRTSPPLLGGLGEDGQNPMLVPLPLSTCLPALTDKGGWAGGGQVSTSRSGLGTSLQTSCLRQPVAIEGPNSTQECQARLALVLCVLADRAARRKDTA